MQYAYIRVSSAEPNTARQDEMYTYIRNNQMMIPNYGEMRRYGEPVSTAFVESTINEVITRRMAKSSRCSGVERAHIICYRPELQS